MMNCLWSIIILFSVIVAFADGNVNLLSSGILNSGNAAVNLAFSLLGTFCLWNGIMNIAEESGLTKKFARLVSPILCKLFKGMNKDDEALLPISLNIASNLLGLSNAATPFGIEAMKRISAKNKNKELPNNNMVLFVVINSAALRLIPSTVAAIRNNHNSQNAMEIMLPSILVSICSLTVGITLAKILERFFKYE